MPLILRIDVDKPYGSRYIATKVLSKIRENYWFPAISFLGYLHYLREFMSFLSYENIPSHIYFRKCTLPPKSWIDDLLFKGHAIGLHAEDTRDFESFKNELEAVKVHFYPHKLNSFSKHGSGKWKGGRDHYPLYEPDNYFQWGKILGVPFLFGNEEIVHESYEIDEQKQFYPSMLWIDRLKDYSQPLSLHWLVEVAKDKNVVVLIHPGFYLTNKRVERDMRELVNLARQNQVIWTTIT